MTEFVLECTGVSKKYGKKEVLKNINLQLERGKIIGHSRTERKRQNNFYQNNKWASYRRRRRYKGKRRTNQA